MRYPWLDVPVLTPTFIFSIFAFTFSFVVHYAVGGGLLLALENGRALRAEDTKYRAYLKKYAKFFVEFTSTFGLVLGVGTWFAAGLTAPFATESFVRIFVFALAIEGLLIFQAFVVAFAFYYCWDKLSARASRVFGWLYAFTAWIAFALASSLASFTLNSEGIVGDWESTDELWRALLNIQFPAQLIARTGVAVMIGAFFYMIHASYVEKDFNLRERIAVRMRIPSFVGMFLLVVGIVGGARTLTDSSFLTLERAASSSAYVTSLIASLFAILVLLIVGPCRRPREINVAQSLALLALGFATLGAVEGEATTLRRPYGVDRVVYRTQISRADVAQARQTGIIYLGTWTTLALDALQEEYPDLSISAQKYLGAESIHLEPPTVPVPVDEEENGEESGEDEGGEEFAPSNENEVDASLDSAAEENDSSAWFALTAAQRLIPEQQSQNGFAPVATPPGPVSLTPTQSPSLNQASSLQNPSLVGGNPTAAPQNANQPVSPRLTNGAAPRSLRQPEAQVEVSVLNPTESASQRVGGATPVNNVAPSVGDAPVAPVVDQPARQTPRRPTRPALQSPSATPNNSAAPPVANAAPAPQSVASVAGTAPAVQNVVPVEIAAAPIPDLAPEPVSEDSVDEDQTRALPGTLDLDVYGPIARGNDDLLKVDRRDRRELGRMVFLRNCNACHAGKHGFSAVGPRVGGRSVAEIRDFVTRLNYTRFDMPPWAGTEVEAELLAEYLDSIAPKVPDSAFMKDKPKKEKESPKTEEGEESEQEDATSEESRGDDGAISGDDPDELTEL